MSDIDFDELDQAVNALMKDKDEPTSSDQTPVTVNNPTSVSQSDSVESPVVVAPENNLAPDNVGTTEPSQPVSVAKPTAQPLSVKRRGRFMDVVHPKSDMTTQLPTKHQTTVVRPVIQDMGQPAKTSDDSESAPQEVAQEEPNVVETPNTPLYPDPIDLHENTVFSQGTMTQEEVKSPDTLDSLDDTETSQTVDGVYEESEASQSSPFIADAKVEKRPLGGAVQIEDESPEVSTFDANLPGSEPEAQVAPVPVTSLPPELQPDVAKLDTEVIEVAAPAEQLVEEKSVVKPETVVPAGGSISQQYTEQPSSVDQANGSIYDTDSYHQPLQHPEKKKSSAVIIVWILVLALMGAIGAAGYFYMTMR